MATAPAQSYANHRRLVPAYHFIAIPLLLLNVVGAIVHTYRHPERMALLGILTAIALLIIGGLLRGWAVQLQDRLIRLEMRLRLERVLPAESRSRIGELAVGQLVALRFASDAELPALVARTLAGEFTSSDAIKRAITSWQADHLRV